VDQALAHLHEIPVPEAASATRARPPVVAERAPDFVQRVTAVMLAGKGDLLPVSAFPVDGTWPVGTAKWEKRNLALEIPVWDEKVCIQCNQCAMVCPHAAIRAKVYDEGAVAGAPPTFKSTPYKGKEHKGSLYTIQVAPEDCTGCNLCVNVCPAKDRTNPRHKAIDMHPQAPLRDAERANYDFFLDLPESDRAEIEFGRLRVLRRDAYCRSRSFRRSAAHGQRHGLFVDLGGNLPTTPHTRRRGRLMGELAVRGQRIRLVRIALGAWRPWPLLQTAPQVGDGLARAARGRPVVEVGIAEQRGGSSPSGSARRSGLLRHRQPRSSTIW
jgi:pyruvate-ferredoxin/flavodoxin oxidoreductase